MGDYISPMWKCEWGVNTPIIGINMGVPGNSFGLQAEVLLA
jgi:hypothetical protein